MVNVIGIDRVVFTTDYPYANMKATRQFFDQMPISHADKEKIAHLNAERLLVKRAVTPTPRATSSIKGADIHEK
jgi:predicted TIM-barrel fold metal-dependent hydrolase